MPNDPVSATKPKIGVFDSGIGGLSVVAAIKASFPEYEIVFRQDEAHFPYGTKQPGHILRYVEPILQDMVHEGCGVIVIACNTTATVAINYLRQLVKVPLIGIQPMVEAGIRASATGKIAVCATPTTYASPVYQSLKTRHAAGGHVYEIECRDWPYMVDRDPVDNIKIGKRIEEVLEYGVDVIVLACTHYSWIGESIRYVAALHGATVIESRQATIEWLGDVLKSFSTPEQTPTF